MLPSSRGHESSFYLPAMPCTSNKEQQAQQKKMLAQHQEDKDRLVAEAVTHKNAAERAHERVAAAAASAGASTADQTLVGGVCVWVGVGESGMGRWVEGGFHILCVLFISLHALQIKQLQEEAESAAADIVHLREVNARRAAEVCAGCAWGCMDAGVVGVHGVEGVHEVEGRRMIMIARRGPCPDSKTWAMP